MKLRCKLLFSIVVATCFAALLVPLRAEADDGEQIPEWLIEYCEEMANWPPNLPPTNYERCQCDYFLQRIPRSIVRQLCDYWHPIHPGTYGDPSLEEGSAVALPEPGGSQPPATSVVNELVDRALQEFVPPSRR